MRLGMLAAFAVVVGVEAADTIPASEAAKYAGQTQTVCGVVASTRYLADSARKPTFLNFDKAYPDHTFTAVVVQGAREKFPEAPEKAYLKKTICVRGEIKMSRGSPEIVVTDPAQITVLAESAPADAPAVAPAAGQ